MVLTICTGLITLPLLTSIINGPSIPEDELESLIKLCLYLLIYLGVRRKKKWVVPLVLSTSAISSLICFLYVLNPATEAKLLLAKGVVALLCLFFAYQMIFFSKKEVRAIFGINEKIIFGS